MQMANYKNLISFFSDIYFFYRVFLPQLFFLDTVVFYFILFDW